MQEIQVKWKQVAQRATLIHLSPTNNLVKKTGPQFKVSS